MQPKRPNKNIRIEIGRQLARKLYDEKFNQLVNMSEAEKARLAGVYPGLSNAEFNDVFNQVIEARRFQQERIGWQAVPHDITILVFVAVTYLVNLRTGVIAGIGTLVLFESLFQFYFNRRLYQYLSLLVWLTYPAYALLAYVLYQRGFTIILIAMTVAIAWGGIFLLGIVARFPVRLILEGKAKGAQETTRLKQN
jgi:hypothetical protein